MENEEYYTNTACNFLWCILIIMFLFVWWPLAILFLIMGLWSENSNRRKFNEMTENSYTQRRILEELIRQNKEKL
jgi:uncharacterized membrane protein